MKTLKKALPLFVIFSFIFNFGSFTYTKEIPRDIVIAFKVGSAEELARHFNKTIELVIVDTEDVYSNIQAQQIMDNFFTNHYPKKFELIHKGGKEESKFAIGKLVTFNGTFRVYILIKVKNNKPLIHQLRIETEDDR
ncbi:MAG: DUF4783 domain-containing protein [Bacteroidales bacterium]|nr:DUF4783 domain-containing protein [Bacteroidales bacterium]